MPRKKTLIALLIIVSATAAEAEFTDDDIAACAMLGRLAAVTYSAKEKGTPVTQLMGEKDIFNKLRIAVYKGVFGDTETDVRINMELWCLEGRERKKGD